MLTWHEVYAETRIAFGNLPDVRLSVSEDPYTPARFPNWTITATGMVDGQMFQLQWRIDKYSQGAEPRYIRMQAYDAARKWQYEVDIRQEHTTYDLETIYTWARKATINIKVNEAWRGNLWMRFDKDSNVWVSPAAFADLMRHGYDDDPYSVFGPNDQFRIGAFPNSARLPFSSNRLNVYSEG